MKIQETSEVCTWSTSTQWFNGQDDTPSTGYFTNYLSRGNSSTSTVQNKGDHKNGTPYFYEYTRSIALKGNFSYAFSNRIVRGSGGILTAATVEDMVDFDFVNLQNAAITKLYDKIRGNVDLSVDAFQMRETVRMIASPIKTLARTIKAFKMKTIQQYRKNFQLHKSSLDHYLSQKWLEYQYGWRPLVNTIYEIAGQMGNIGKAGPSTQLFKASEKSDSESKRTYNQTAAGASHTLLERVTGRGNVTMYMRLKLSDSSKAKMAATYTSMNPSSIAWELVPFSFVADWVYDIGSYLRSCESALIYKSAWQASWHTRFKVIDVQTAGMPYSGTQNKTGTLNGHATRKYVYFRRYAHSEPPSPSKPVVGAVSSLSWQRLTSAVALLVSNTRR